MIRLSRMGKVKKRIVLLPWVWAYVSKPLSAEDLFGGIESLSTRETSNSHELEPLKAHAGE
jgi:hypothetical protein